MPYYVHVNGNMIRSNAKHQKTDPVIRVQRGRYGKSKYVNHVKLPPGSEVIYRPHGDPLLPCGARLVIVCPEDPEVVDAD